MNTELINNTQTTRLVAIEQFKSYIFGIPIDSLFKYEFGFTHDGFYFFNPHSNSFTGKEIEVFDGFCNMYKYSFSIFGRKWDNVSGYGSLGCEIQCL
jgi:hypothetical protein